MRNYSLAVGSALLGWMALLAVLHSVVFMLGGVVHPATTILATALAFAGLWFLVPAGSKIKALTMFGGLLAVTLMGAAFTTDASYDGNTYHQAAVGALRYGWNPVWESIASFNTSSRNPVVLPDAYELWNDHYPKATWIFGASMYQLTGSIEAGKAFNFLLLLALFFTGFGYFGTRFGVLRGGTLAGLLTLNPVAVAQVFTYYNDGALGSILSILLILFSILLDRSWTAPPSWRRAFWPTIAAAFIVICNLKFTGLVYSSILGLIYVAALVILGKPYRASLKAICITGIASALVAVVIVGSSSYVRNFVNTGNPLYPLVGSNREDILSDNEPIGLAGKGRLAKIIYANLALSEVDAGYSGPLLKMPFTAKRSELQTFFNPDVRLGGYGVWFGGLLITSLVIGISMLVCHIREASGRIRILFLAPVVVTIMGLCLVEGTWWARYAPYLWTIPVLVVASLYALNISRRFIPWALAIALFINSASIGAAQILLQIRMRHAPSFAERVSRTHTCALYSGNFSGAMYGLVDEVPSLRVLGKEEFESHPLQDYTALDVKDIVGLTKGC